MYDNIMVIQIKYGLPYCVICPSMSSDPGSINTNTRRSLLKSPSGEENNFFDAWTDSKDTICLAIVGQRYFIGLHRVPR